MFHENVGKPACMSLVGQGLEHIGDMSEAISGGGLPRREAHFGPVYGLCEGLHQFFVLGLGL